MRICFYSEYNIVGGATTLVITLIKELHKQNIDVILFNFKEGIIAAELNKANVHINIIDIRH